MSDTSPPIVAIEWSTISILYFKGAFPPLLLNTWVEIGDWSGYFTGTFRRYSGEWEMKIFNERWRAGGTKGEGAGGRGRWKLRHKDKTASHNPPSLDWPATTSPKIESHEQQTQHQGKQPRPPDQATNRASRAWIIAIELVAIYLLTRPVSR